MSNTLCTPAKSNSAPCHTRPLTGGDFRPRPRGAPPPPPPPPPPPLPLPCTRSVLTAHNTSPGTSNQQAVNKRPSHRPIIISSPSPLRVSPRREVRSAGYPWVRADPRVQPDEQAVNRLPTSDPAINILQRFLPADDSRLPAEDSPASSSLHAPTDEQQGSPLAGEQEGNKPRTGAPATSASAVRMTSGSVSPASPESRARMSRVGHLTPPRAPSVPYSTLVPLRRQAVTLARLHRRAIASRIDRPHAESSHVRSRSDEPGRAAETQRTGAGPDIRAVLSRLRALSACSASLR
jgi:hypothetical protein